MTIELSPGASVLVSPFPSEPQATDEFVFKGAFHSPTKQFGLMHNGLAI